MDSSVAFEEGQKRSDQIQMPVKIWSRTVYKAGLDKPGPEWVEVACCYPKQTWIFMMELGNYFTIFGTYEETRAEAFNSGKPFFSQIAASTAVLPADYTEVPHG